MRILMATDFRPAARAALSQAALLSQALDGEVVLAHAVEWAGNPGAAHERAETYLRQAAHACRDAGGRVSSTEVLRFEKAEVLIARSAQELDVDLVVLACGPPGGLGSVARSVVREVRFPLWLHQGDPQPIARVLWSSQARHRALPELAKRLSRSFAGCCTEELNDAGTAGASDLVFLEGGSLPALARVAWVEQVLESVNPRAKFLFVSQQRSPLTLVNGSGR